MSARVKPLIRRGLDVGRMRWEWTCSDRSDCYAYGWGDTPEAAYEHWLAQFAACRRSRLK